MRISNRFNRERSYTGMRLRDGFPWMAEEIHQLQDNIFSKLREVVRTFKVGGLHSTGSITLEEGKIKIRPSVVSINGEVFNIDNQGGLIEIEIPEGVEPRTDVLLVETYFRHVNSQTEIHRFGGLDNDVIENEMIIHDSGIQTSTRIQLCWRLRYVTDAGDLTHLNVRDVEGEELPVKLSPTGQDSVYVGFHEDIQTIDKRCHILRLMNVLIDTDDIKLDVTNANITASNIILDHPDGRLLSPDMANAIYELLDNLEDSKTFDFTEYSRLPGYEYVTTFDSPTPGDITEHIKRVSDGSIYATRVTEFDKPSEGDITETLTCPYKNISTRKITKFDSPSPGQIQEIVEEV